MTTRIRFGARSLAAFAVASALAGCSLHQPTLGQLVEGEGPTIARADLELRVRHTELLPVTLLFPARPDGVPDPVAGGRPALVLVQGGAVAPEQYLWLAEALARRGFVVALPRHLADLAILEIDNGRWVRDWLAAPPAGSLTSGLVDPARIAVGGHSLGGVVAVKLALEGGFGALALLASFPDAADAPRLAGLGMPSLSLAGASDCKAKLDDVRAGWAQLPPPTVLAVLGGVTHYQFTADPSPDDRSGCAYDLPLAEAHARIEAVVATFLDAALSATPSSGAEAIAGLAGLLELEAR